MSSESFINEALPVQKASVYNIENEIIIHSPCGKYNIKYAKDFEFVYVFNDRDEFIFRLNHNTYKSHYCCNIIEFVKDEIVINDEHSSLGIYDMQGKLRYNVCGFDDFYTQKFRVTDDDTDYLVLYGFIWSPVHFMSIYDLNKMVVDESYEPDRYWEKDTRDLGVTVTSIDNKVCYGMTPSVFKSFMIDKKNKEVIEKQELLNTRWTEDNILKIIVNDYPVDETIKNKILSSIDCPNITCFGGKSGSEFKEHAENIILKSVNNRKIIDFIARIIICDDYTKYSSNGTDLKEVNLIFTIDDILKIHIIIPMTKIAQKDTYWFPENDEHVVINFTVV